MDLSRRANVEVEGPRAPAAAILEIGAVRVCANATPPQPVEAGRSVTDPIRGVCAIAPVAVAAAARPWWGALVYPVLK